MTKLHPQIWEIVLKSYRYAHDANDDNSYLQDILQVLPLSIDFNPTTDRNPLHVENYLKDYLSSLPLEDSLKVIQDVLEDDNIKRMKYDNWNYFGDFVREWRDRIIKYLEKSSIKFDEENGIFRNTKNKPILMSAYPNKDDFISSKFDDVFYNDLKQEINKCCKLGLCTSGFILSRKIIENLVIDVLRLKFPANGMGNLELYYRTDGGRFHDFSVLVEKLEEKKDEFGIDEPIITEFISLVKPFRPQSNSSAHSIITEAKEQKLKDAKVERMVELLLKLKKNLIREINSTKSGT